MAQLAFRATCQRDHDLETFTDPKAFEAHMTKGHKARKLAPAKGPGSRKGGLPAKYLTPNRAPKGTEGLTKVLAAAADEYVNHGRPVGSVRPVTDWHTDELVTLEEVRTGDVFRMGRHEYVCHDRDAFLVTGPGQTEPIRPRNLEDRLGATVVIVKRAA